MSNDSLCPAGKEFGVRYSCATCFVSVHHPSTGCGCVSQRSNRMGFFCPNCMDALDILEADTHLGKLHKHLINTAHMKYMPSSD